MRAPVLPRLILAVPVLSAPVLVAPVFLAGPAHAHAGHLGELAGHDHWVAGAAVGAAVLIGLWGALKGKRKPEPAEPDAAEPDDQEQTA
jgi:hypothetical protein